MDFTSTLLIWYGAHARQLPWRGTGNPYHVWLSEVILQQTRVAQGTAYYFRFLEHFPSIRALAEAPLDEVMKCWQGLGYYTRARNLHKAAQKVVAEYGGELPNRFEELKKLPGLGPYAAGAVASFAFNEAVPALDGNGYRVLARVFGIFEIPTTTKGAHLFRQHCFALMDKGRPADFNQALIDFGALQCVPGTPDCTVCPLTSSCYASKHHKQLELPLKATPIALRVRYFHYLILLDGDYTYIELRRAKDIWHSLYQFPLVESTKPLTGQELAAKSDFKELVAEGTKILTEVPETVQKLTHQELHLRFFILEGRPSDMSLSRFERIPRTSLPSYQVPICIAKFLTSEWAARFFLTTTTQQ